MIFFLYEKELMQLVNLQDRLLIWRYLFLRLDVFFHLSFYSVKIFHPGENILLFLLISDYNYTTKIENSYFLQSTENLNLDLVYYKLIRRRSNGGLRVCYVIESAK